MSATPSSIPAGVLTRIQKCLNLAHNKGATEAEAVLALQRAQEMAAQYNMNIAEIAARGGTQHADAGDKRTRDAVRKRTVYRWLRDLMAATADLNFCACLQRWENRNDDLYGEKPKVFDGFDLVGREANIASTQVMFDYLVEAIERLAREYVNNDGARVFTKPAIAFREGCAERIVERLRDKKEAILAEQERKAREQQATSRHPGAAPSTALVVILRDYAKEEAELNEDMVCGYEPGTMTKRRMAREAEEAQRRVVQAEREARLKKLVDDGTNFDVAWNMVYLDMTYEQAVTKEDEARQRVAHPAEPESARQRKRRESSDRWWERQKEARRRQEDRAAERRAAPGFRDGRAAGEGIGLDDQVAHKPGRRLG